MPHRVTASEGRVGTLPVIRMRVETAIMLRPDDTARGDTSTNLMSMPPVLQRRAAAKRRSSPRIAFGDYLEMEGLAMDSSEKYAKRGA